MVHGDGGPCCAPSRSHTGNTVPTSPPHEETVLAAARDVFERLIKSRELK